jgi:hypothetical protein
MSKINYNETFSHRELLVLDHCQIDYQNNTKDRRIAKFFRNAQTLVGICDIFDDAVLYGQHPRASWVAASAAVVALASHGLSRKYDNGSNEARSKAIDMSLAKNIVPPAWVYGKTTYDLGSTAVPGSAHRVNKSIPANA